MSDADPVSPFLAAAEGTVLMLVRHAEQTTMLTQDPARRVAA